MADWIDGGENKRLDEVLGNLFGDVIEKTSSRAIMKKVREPDANFPASMDRSRYEKMKAGLSKLGVNCKSALDGDDLRYLQWFQSEALMQWPNQILHMREVPSASALFEEILHWQQYRTNGATYCGEHRILMEYQANAKLLKHASAYGFDKQDTIDIQNNLAKYLNALKKEGIDIGEIPQL